MSFRSRLLVSQLAIIFLSLLLFYLGVQRWLHQFYLETVSENLRNQALVLSELFQVTDLEVDRRVDSAAAAVPYRITVIDPNGRVVADSVFSGAALKELEDHSKRPEIIEAARDGVGTSLRYSTSVEDDLLYVAASLPSGSGYIRIATPVSRVEEVSSSLRRQLLFILALLLLVAALGTWVVSRRPTRAVAALTAAASRAKALNYDLTIPVASRGELGRLARTMETMAETIRNQITTLEAERNHLHTILNSITEGLMVTDSRGRVVETNASLRRMFQVEGDPHGKLPLEVVRSDEIKTGIESVLQEASPRQAEIRLGSSAVQARFNPIEGAGGIEGVVMVLHDITELKRLDNLRKEFVSNVSHELRTPLTSIRGYSELLLEEMELEGQQKNFLERIIRHSESLTQMINELMELARLEGQDQKVRREIVSFESLMEQMETEIEPVLRQKSIQFKWRNSSDRDTFVAENTYLRRIFRNLLDNALKYTEQGEVRVEMKQTADGLEFTVSDTGIGIPEADIDRIFERFYRVARDRSRASGGTGIGLAIVKHMVQLHGGRIWAESRVNEGTTIHFSIPN